MRTVSARTVVVSLFLLAASNAFAGPCENLAGTKLPHTTLSIAQSVTEGTFKPPYGNEQAKHPALCRVAGVVNQEADSYIRFVAWMPASGCNDMFLGVGNGGVA